MYVRIQKKTKLQSCQSQDYSMQHYILFEKIEYLGNLTNIIDP